MVTHGPQLDAPLSDGLRHPIELIDSFAWEEDLGDAMVDLTGMMTSRKVWREPVGVVGAIVPWNYPFEVSIHKLGQALSTGNTVVLKAAPDTPFNATRIGRLVAEHTDIPAGVLNVVTSSDHLVGEELTLSDKVDLISFTGSTAVGKRIMEKGAATMKRLFLELGGKSAAVILDDADLATATMIAFGVCMHAGQGCATPTRMLLPRSRYDEAVEMLTGIYESVVPGDPQARRHPLRSGDLGQAAGPDHRLHPDGDRRGRQLAGRRHGAAGRARHRLLRVTVTLRRRRQLDDDRPRGDLRSGARRDPVRGRGRRDPDRERQPVRVGRVRLVELSRSLDGRRADVCAPGPSG